jgi:hypothetical protein
MQQPAQCRFYFLVLIFYWYVLYIMRRKEYYIICLLYMIIVQVRYITIETREVTRTWYNVFPFPHSYYATRLSPHSYGKRNPLYPIRVQSLLLFQYYFILYFIGFSSELFLGPNSGLIEWNNTPKTTSKQ